MGVKNRATAIQNDPEKKIEPRASGGGFLDNLFISKELGGLTKECDLVAHVPQGGIINSFLYDPVAGNFIPGDGTARITDATLRALAATPGQEVTYTCVPPGSGARIILNQ